MKSPFTRFGFCCSAALALIVSASYCGSLFAAPATATPAETPVAHIRTVVDLAQHPEINADALTALENLLAETRTRQAIVWHDGTVIAEWYWLEGQPETPVEVWSMSKSFASTCIGMLIDEGKIGSIEEPASKYIPDWSTGEKSKIKIKHLLDQTSGLKDNAGADAPFGLLQRCLDAEVLTEPGKVSKYNNGACNTLSAIISKAAGKDPEAYMREKMWKPLGMDHTSWRRDLSGNVLTYAGIQSTARDVLKFGELFYRGGMWNGQRILSQEWIDTATSPRTTMTIAMARQRSKYGLLWWVDGEEGTTLPHNYNALGLWGNNLTVIPELKLIGVRLAGNNPDAARLMKEVPLWVEMLAGVVKQAK